MKYIVQHPITSIAKILAFVLAWYFFGWKMALITILLSIEVTVSR